MFGGKVPSVKRPRVAEAEQEAIVAVLEADTSSTCGTLSEDNEHGSSTTENSTHKESLANDSELGSLGSLGIAVLNEAPLGACPDDQAPEGKKSVTPNECGKGRVKRRNLKITGKYSGVLATLHWEPQRK